MLPVASIKPLLKYFDAIDRNATAGLMDKKPDSETTTTQNLCSLLDKDEQKRFALDYNFSDLSKDLFEYAGGLRLEVSFETHEYNPSVENRITQSDIGLIINYLNHYEPDLCWTESWLFQAKSLKLFRSNPSRYTEKSRFDSISADQIKRIKTLRKLVGIDFIKFMEYCPRAYLLDKDIKDKLINYRNIALSGHIFDYALGLELHDCLMRADQKLEPGIFVSSVEMKAKTKTYLDLYKNFWKDSHPFSWFILSRLSIPNFNDHGSVFPHREISVENRVKITPSRLTPRLDPNSVEGASLAHGIVRCDLDAIDNILRRLGEPNGDFTFHPARTISITLSVAGD